MKKFVRMFAAAALAACMSLTLTACGGDSEDDFEDRLETLDDLDDDEIEDMIEKGAAKLDAEEDAGDYSADSSESAAAEYLAKRLYSAAGDYISKLADKEEAVPDFDELKYDLLDEKSGKFEAEIGGKTKKVKWNLDDAEVYGKVSNYKLRYVSVTVDGVTAVYPEGADKVEEIDPFEDLSVTFTGTSPQSKVVISGGNSLCSYTADVTSGMFNGDVITVTAAFKSAQKTKALSEETREYTANGLPAYAMALADIPQETLDKMDKQAQDTIKSGAASWVEGNSLKSAELIGYYYLSLKEGFSDSTVNQIYLVYKVTADITGIRDEVREEREVETGEEVYYTCYEYKNIINIDENTCSVDLSAGRLTGNKISTNHGYWSWGYFEHYSLTGYGDLDSMFNKCVTEKIDKYSYESTVKE